MEATRVGWSIATLTVAADYTIDYSTDPFFPDSHHILYDGSITSNRVSLGSTIHVNEFSVYRGNCPCPPNPSLIVDGPPFLFLADDVITMTENGVDSDAEATLSTGFIDYVTCGGFSWTVAGMDPVTTDGGFITNQFSMNPETWAEVTGFSYSVTMNVYFSNNAGPFGSPVGPFIGRIPPPDYPDLPIVGTASFGISCG